jgi:MSHA pilin protein MshC
MFHHPTGTAGGPGRSSQSGFTLIEIVSVLVLLSILTAVAVARVSSMRAAEAVAAADVLKAHLRHAQASAMNSTVSYGIQTHSSGTSYFMFENGDTVNGQVRLPGEDSNTVPVRSGASVTPSFTISFDTFGRPCTDTGGSTLQSGTRTLAVTREGSVQTITITPNTGFIP